MRIKERIFNILKWPGTMIADKWPSYSKTFFAKRKITLCDNCSAQLDAYGKKQDIFTYSCLVWLVVLLVWLVVLLTTFTIIQAI